METLNQVWAAAAAPLSPSPTRPSVTGRWVMGEWVGGWRAGLQRDPVWFSFFSVSVSVWGCRVVVVIAPTGSEMVWEAGLGS